MEFKIYNSLYLKTLSTKQIDFFLKNLKPNLKLNLIFKIRKQIYLLKTKNYIIFDFKIFKIPDIFYSIFYSALFQLKTFRYSSLKNKDKIFFYYFISIHKKIGKVNKRIYIKRFINKLLVFNFKRTFKNSFKDLEKISNFSREHIIVIIVKAI